MRIAVSFFGALLVVGGIAALIVAPRHAPNYVQTHPGRFCVEPCSLPTHNIGWSQTLYDLARIGGWALVVFGALIIAVALIREFRTTT
jgi:hypothetical protein